MGKTSTLWAGGRLWLLVACCICYLAPCAVGQEGLLAQGRTGFVNGFITDLMAPFQTRVGSTEVGLREVKLKDLNVHDPKSGQLVLSIKEALWSPTWTALAGGDYGELSLRGVRVLVTGETEAAVSAWLKPSGKAGTGGIRFSKLLLTDAQIRLRPTPQIPALEVQIEGMLRGLDTRSGLVVEQLQLALKRLKVQPLNAPAPAVEMPSLMLDMSLSAAGQLVLQQLLLPELTLHWGEQLARYLPAAPAGPAPASKPLIKSLLVKLCQIEKTKLSCTRTAALPYEGKLELVAALRELAWDGQRWSSAQAQQLELQAVSLAHHPLSRDAALAPFAQLQEGKLALVPDAWAKGQRVELCSLLAPRVSWREELMPWLKEQAAVPQASPAVAAQKLTPHFGQLLVKAGQLDYAAVHGERVEFSSGVEVDHRADGAQRLCLKEMSLSVPTRSPLPVARVPELTLVAALPALWSSYEVQSLTLRGGSVEVGDALAALTPAEAKPVVAGGSPPAASPWLLKEVALEDTTITLQRVAPGLPPVKFAIDFAAKDLPLSLSRMSGRTERLSVELSQLAIRSPYESLREVARLPHSFVEFTLDGLARRRIEQVKIVSPTLFIGEDLFWYIDYYRKYASGEDVSDFHKKVAVALASVVPQDALVAAAIQETAPQASSGGWSIGTLEVNSGKLVLAPKGYPLPGIPRPFPFSFTSHMDHGRIEAEFEIPSDDYTWAPIQLKLEGLSGKVQFNLPLRDRSNNLTEVFRVKRIRYKKLHVEDAHLSVTYDANGIYGQFGGEAYEGYVKGAFNVYMGTGYPWDGWITGTGVRSTEITQQMCPAYFLLDGKVDVSAILNGDEKSLFQTDLKFNNKSPGRFSVTALNEMISSLPGDWPSYMRDATRIGMETLRDFQYDTVSSEARFYGRSGKGFMKFKGPTGSRNIDVNLHDERLQR